MRHLILTIFTLGTAGAAAIAPTLAQAQDADAGRKVFHRCSACHTTAEGGRNRAGPNLWGIFGSTSASRPIGYGNYSDAMKAAGVVWTDETLSEFVRKPRSFISGTRMSFPGIRDDQQLKDLIAYLKSVTR